MRAPKKKKEGLVEIPTSSLADIIFLLLIFFIVSTSMSTDKGLGLVLPPQGEDVKLDSKDILTIYINSEGRILAREDVVELKDVKKLVEDEIEKNPKLVISLRTDVEATYDNMIQVLDQLKLADAKTISLATPEF